MARANGIEPTLDLKPLIDLVGVKQVIDQVGLKRVLAEVGLKKVLDEADSDPAGHQLLREWLLRQLTPDELRELVTRRQEMEARSEEQKP